MTASTQKTTVITNTNGAEKTITVKGWISKVSTLAEAAKPLTAYGAKVNVKCYLGTQLQSNVIFDTEGLGTQVLWLAGWDK
jgi:hypothetical protein